LYNANHYHDNNKADKPDSQLGHNAKLLYHLNYEVVKNGHSRHHTQSIPRFPEEKQPQGQGHLMEIHIAGG